jgi:excisionase family DNA binding protein
VPHDQYQSVSEIAERLKVHEATVRRWIKDGELRAIDIGKGWRISDSDLALFLHHHATRPRQGGEREAAAGVGRDAGTTGGDVK